MRDEPEREEAPILQVNDISDARDRSVEHRADAGVSSRQPQNRVHSGRASCRICLPGAGVAAATVRTVKQARARCDSAVSDQTHRLEPSADHTPDPALVRDAPSAAPAAAAVEFPAPISVYRYRAAGAGGCRARRLEWPCDPPPHASTPCTRSRSSSAWRGCRSRTCTICVARWPIAGGEFGLQATRGTTVSIAERRRPDPQGQPGYLRVDTVHQGRQDGKAGPYHINSVDTVTHGKWWVAAQPSARTI